MITILVTTDSISAGDLTNCMGALNRVLAKWAPAWGITVTATTDPKVKADMIIKVTDVNRHVGAYGYHTVEKGVPTSYCSPSAVGRTYGHYTPAFYTKARKFLGKVIKPAQLVHGALYTSGLVTVIIHEALEMLADAHIDKVAKAPDGKNWLVEVADHASGLFGIEVVNGQTCVIPDSTLPSYYDLNGKAPFDIFGALKTPFDKSAPKFYAYYKDASGKLIKV